MRASFLVVAALAIGHSGVYGANCGQTVSADQIENLSAPLLQGRDNLMRHSEALLAEMKMLVGQSGFDNVVDEQTSVDQMLTYIEGVREGIDRMALLVVIRGSMIDKRDRIAVEDYLAIEVVSTAKITGHAQAALARVLTRVSRPVIAVDGARLRDTLTSVEKALRGWRCQ
jgi:hypothetical protein